jgi:hypothetical protein
VFVVDALLVFLLYDGVFKQRLDFAQNTIENRLTSIGRRGSLPNFNSFLHSTVPFEPGFDTNFNRQQMDSIRLMVSRMFIFLEKPEFLLKFWALFFDEMFRSHINGISYWMD